MKAKKDLILEIINLGGNMCIYGHSFDEIVNLFSEVIDERDALKKQVDEFEEVEKQWQSLIT